MGTAATYAQLDRVAKSAATAHASAPSPPSSGTRRVYAWAYLDDSERSAFLQHAWERRFSHFRGGPSRREIPFILDSLSEGVFPRAVGAAKIEAVLRVTDEYGLVVDARQFARTGGSGMVSAAAARRRARAFGALLAVSFLALAVAFMGMVAEMAGLIRSPLFPITSADVAILLLVVIATELSFLGVSEAKSR